MKKRLRIAIATSIHKDFDARIWKHATSLVALGHDVHLVCPWPAPASGEQRGVQFHPFKRVVRRLFRPFLIPLRVLSRLIPLLGKVDIVHFHDLDLLPWMALISLARPTVYDVHENYPEEMLVREYIPPLLRRPLYHAVRWGQLALSIILRNIVLVVPSQKVHLNHTRFRTIEVRNYASLALLERARDDYHGRADVVIFTGLHYVNNGSLLILEIAERTKEAHPRLTFHLIDFFEGDALKSRFLDELHRRGLDDRVRLLPPVPSQELIGLLNSATIGLSPNLRVRKQIMALPTKLFEYMAAGLPIVASDLPSAAEIIGTHEAGLLAQPEDPETFVRAIDRLIRDRSFARQLGRNGQRAFRERFSWESQMPALVAYYHNILGSSKG